MQAIHRQLTRHPAQEWDLHALAREQGLSTSTFRRTWTRLYQVPPMQDRFSALKERQREIREEIPPEISLRIHRALSWLQAAEQAPDEDTTFIQLWICFTPDLLEGSVLHASSNV